MTGGIARDDPAQLYYYYYAAMHQTVTILSLLCAAEGNLRVSRTLRRSLISRAIPRAALASFPRGESSDTSRRAIDSLVIVIRQFRLI